MARSTRKSLASTAASAARKVISRTAAQESGATETDAQKSAEKAASSKKAAPKKAVSQKKATPAKKAASTKKTASTTKATPAKKGTSAKKTPSAKKGTSARKGTSAKKVASVTKPAAKKATAATRTTPAKKAASPDKAGALKVKEGEGAWTKAELKEVLDELHALRARVVRTLAEQEEELAHLMRDAGDGAGQDQADMGATSFERDHELTVVNNEREKLAQIDRALARIADGTYGVCESCGNPIGKMRVMAFPRATLCLTCKQREERR